MDVITMKKAADSLRVLSADMIQKANSGHPGLPLGMADVMTVLWLKYLNHDPADPHWPGRDRFVLSPGHGSAMLYSLLHLSGYDLPMDELKHFRQWGSRTPGHPEYGHTPGVEVTTGPLGQGFANGAGMALASGRIRAEIQSRTDTEGLTLPRIWALVSDGDMMEGISHEAASLAGHLKLGNMIYIYDSNRISIEGSTDITFTDDTAGRFKAYGWTVLEMDGHNLEEIDSVLAEAVRMNDGPVLIIARSHIGKGSPNKIDTASVHGSPLGNEELALMKRGLGFDEDTYFEIPDDVRDLYRRRTEELSGIHRDRDAAWGEVLAKTGVNITEMLKRPQPDAEDLFRKLEKSLSGKAAASRASGGRMLQIIAGEVPYLFGGSADLAPSNSTLLKDHADVKTGDLSGRNMRYGIREHAMGAITNGIALFGAHIPFDATFLVFSDYMRPALRLAAMMKLQTIHVFTHDSVYVGEDGPTHQPVEHLAALRLIPGLTVIRPADELETAAAWAMAAGTAHTPVCLILSRQTIPNVPREKGFSFADYQKGAYIVMDAADGSPDIVILATGSEVPVAAEALALRPDRNRCRLVSVSSVENLKRAEAEFLERMIPAAAKLTVSFEAGAAGNWSELAAGKHRHIGLDHFGQSAPAEVLREKFGLDSAGFNNALDKILKEMF